MGLLFENRVKTLLDLRKREEQETHSVYLELDAADKSVDTDASFKIYHFDLIQAKVKMGILSKMPWKVWKGLAKCVFSGGKCDRFMCAAVSDPDILGWGAFYEVLIDKAGNEIAEILRIFADASNFPILFHCTHGKDRTGILTCLLGLLVGVPHEAICQDYVQSGLQLKAAKSMYKLPIPDHLMQDTTISAPYEAIDGLIRHIEERYGGIEHYLKAIGLSEQEVISIRKNIQSY